MLHDQVPEMRELQSKSSLNQFVKVIRSIKRLHLEAHVAIVVTARPVMLVERGEAHYEKSRDFEWYWSASWLRRKDLKPKTDAAQYNSHLRNLVPITGGI